MNFYTLWADLLNLCKPHIHGAQDRLCAFVRRRIEPHIEIPARYVISDGAMQMLHYAEKRGLRERRYAGTDNILCSAVPLCPLTRQPVICPL